MKHQSIWIATYALIFAPFIVAYLMDRHARRAPERQLRQDVYDNLDDAVTNEYFGLGEFCYGKNSKELAYDMICYAPGFEDFEVSDVLPYVKEWMRDRWR